MKTTTVQVSELSGAALDWAVAQLDPMCEGLEWRRFGDSTTWAGYGLVAGESTPCAFLSGTADLRLRLRMIRDVVQPYSPSTDWSQGGPLIEKWANGGLIHHKGGNWEATAIIWDIKTVFERGATALEAGCRLVVTLNIGQKVEIPSELLEVTP